MNNEETIFTEALAKASVIERAAYLDAACAGDPSLRRSVDALIDAHARAAGILEAPALGAQTGSEIHPASDGVGTVIGPYKLLEQIGGGGMGVVYMAEQVHPVRRMVALKVIKPGMDSRQVIARFEAERQALTMMDHDNIAKIFEAGTTDSGRPYFVMELVKGIPITDYCDRNKLPPRERLKLFVEVCRAVQHAHTKGIIHRDIKPTNVLVTLRDGVAVPKVIDFGIAKATAQQLTDMTLFTNFAQMVGTPLYMSPEQAEMSGLDADTRSDIYSLGVLLYELLTGTTPVDQARLKLAAFDEVRRIIREEVPPRPSTRLSTIGHQTRGVSAERTSELKTLGLLMRDELDWIVMKALEKDRKRRYETANGFAMDVQRYLNDEAVQACPPSRLYSFGKFSRRHKASIAVAATALLLVLAAVAGLVVTNRLVTRQKDQKEEALARVLQEKQRADQNLARARQAVKEYLVKTAKSPLLQKGDFQPLRKELIETAIPFYEDFVRQDQQDPDLDYERGRAYEDLGFLRRSLAEPERALAELAQAEGIYRRLSGMFPDRPMYRQRLADTQNVRAAVLRELGRTDSAEAALRESLALSEALAAQPGASPESFELAALVANNLGVILKDSNRRPEAETMLRKAIAAQEQLLKQQPAAIQRRIDLARTWLNLGMLLGAQPQKVADAQPAIQKVLELLGAEWIEQLQASPPLMAEFQGLRSGAFDILGVLQAGAGAWSDAEKSYREALPIRQKLVEMFPSNPGHRRSLAGIYGHLAATLDKLQHLEEAQAMHDKAIGLCEQLVAESPENARYAVDLAEEYATAGEALVDRKQLEPALLILIKSIEAYEAAFRRDPRMNAVRTGLVGSHWARATALTELGRAHEALPDFDRALEMDDGQHQIELRLKRASNLLKLKDHVRATADAAAVADNSAATADDLYSAACVHALAADLAHEDAAVVETYSSRAVLVLRQAQAKGYQDAAHLSTDADLNAIRARADFQLLLKEIQGDASNRKGQ